MLRLFAALSSMFKRSINFRVVIISALQHRTLNKYDTKKLLGRTIQETKKHVAKLRLLLKRKYSLFNWNLLNILIFLNLFPFDLNDTNKFCNC